MYAFDEFVAFSDENVMEAPHVKNKIEHTFSKWQINEACSQKPDLQVSGSGVLFGESEGGSGYIEGGYIIAVLG